jgi:peroxiredoxin
MSNKQVTSASWRFARCFIVVLLGVNLLLIRQNLGLRQQLAKFALSGEVATNSLKAGETVPPFTGLDLKGKPYQIEYKKEGRQHLFLFFPPSCSYCDQQAPQWRELLDKIDSNLFTISGVVNDKEDKPSTIARAQALGYLDAKTPLPITFASEAMLKSYKLAATPTTLLVDDKGKVEGAWVGLWDETTADEIAHALQK